MCNHLSLRIFHSCLISLKELDFTSHFQTTQEGAGGSKVNPALFQEDAGRAPERDRILTVQPQQPPLQPPLLAAQLLPHLRQLHDDVLLLLCKFPGKS